MSRVQLWECVSGDGDQQSSACQEKSVEQQYFLKIMVMFICSHTGEQLNPASMLRGRT